MLPQVDDAHLLADLLLRELQQSAEFRLPVAFRCIVQDCNLDHQPHSDSHIFWCP